MDGADGVADLAAWLTTVIARVCLNTRRRRAMSHRQLLASIATQPEAVRALAMGARRVAATAHSRRLSVPLTGQRRPAS